MKKNILISGNNINLFKISFFITIFMLVSLHFKVNAQDQNALAPGDTVPEMTIRLKPNKNLDINIGGAMWFRSIYQPFVQPSEANARGGLFHDQFRITTSGKQQFEGRKGWITFDTQVRWWSYMMVIHTLQVGFHLDEFNSFQIGVTRAPFGMLVATSNSFWYSLGFYHGTEDDRDGGVVFQHRKGPLEFQAAYFANDEYNDPSNVERFSGDLVYFEEQQNSERNQGNLRFAYTFGHGTNNTVQLGLSGQAGQIFNRTTERSGHAWQAAIHADANLGRTNIRLQGTRYEYHVQNPEGVDDRLVLMGLFADRRLIAAKANILNSNLKRSWDINWDPLTSFATYIDYSHVFKDESSFFNSQLFNPGFFAEFGQFHVWGDILWGRNAWWFNDNMENSGPGAGSIRPEKWEFRMLVTIGWFF